MKSHIWLLEALLRDCAVQCSVPPSEVVLDLRTILARVDREGLSFLTITLPELDKALLKGLAEGIWPAPSCTFVAHKRGLPILFRGYLRQIFNADGRLLDEPSVTAIACVRQLSLTFKKVELECSPKRVAAAYAAFVETDGSIAPEPPVTLQISDGERVIPIPYSEVGRVARLLVGPALVDADSALYRGEPIEAKHGKGATAERESRNGKYTDRTWIERFDGVFHMDQYLHSFESSGLVGDSIASLPFDAPIPPDQETPVRVISVPKTMRTPRIIAIEPTLMQYMQQGLLSALTKAVGEDPLLREFLPLSDQSQNGRMALEGSRDGSMATIDLSEASDRVPLWLVKTVFASTPNFLGGLVATRSTRAQVPGAGVIPLRKFASMGSATCFPVESVTFLVLALLGCCIADRRPLSRQALGMYRGTVSVFGDDIIVPRRCTAVVLSLLESVGLKVNRNKTFWSGSFRESCGTDAFKGEVVTPAYLKTLQWDERHLDWLAKWVSFANRLYDLGFWETARAVRENTNKIVRIPTVARTSPAVGWTNVRGTYEVHAWDKALQRFAVRAFTIRSKRVCDPIDGTAALLKCLGTPFNEDPMHLESVVRSASVSTKRRWTAPY